MLYSEDKCKLTVLVKQQAFGKIYLEQNAFNFDILSYVLN